MALHALLPSPHTMHAFSVGIDKPHRIIATGGASANAGITQVLADVFGTSVFTATHTDSASLGAAARALHGFVNAHTPQGGSGGGAAAGGAGGGAGAGDGTAAAGCELVVSFEDAVGDRLTRAYTLAASPSQAAHEAYTAMLPAYRAAEATLIGKA